MSQRELAITLTRQTGLLPCIKLSQAVDCRPYVRAMRAGGARLVEITLTTPGALAAIESVAAEFGDDVIVAAGTVLDASTARAVIQAGGRVLVSPAVVPEVIQMARRYGVACYAGAFTATECLAAMQHGADMVKVFPAQVGGPRYMTNLRMVYPELDLVPSGGISLENAADYIRAGACAVSGARTFMNSAAVAAHGFQWITQQVARFLQVVAEARAENSTPWLTA